MLKRPFTIGIIQSNFLRISFPVLFAIYPAISLWFLNFDKLLPHQVARSFQVLLGVALAALFLLTLAFRSYRRAAVFFSFASQLFFMHGIFRVLAENIDVNLGVFRVGPDKFAAALLLILFAGLFWILKYEKYVEKLSLILVRMAVSLLLLKAIMGAIRVIGNLSASDHKPREKLAGIAQRVSVTADMPDIYYIILDGYGRADNFKKILSSGFDNHKFIEELRSKGFYVANESRSNYDQTHLSLASSLNFEYVQSPSMDDCQAQIRNNKTFKFLRQRGYKTFAFFSGSSITNLNHAVDEFIETGLFNLNSFEIQLLNMTPLPYLVPAFLTSKTKLFFDLSVIYPYRQHYNRIHNTLYDLPKLASKDSPKFVFAHILAPHPPFVFNQDGVLVSEDRPFSFGVTEWKAEGYVHEVIHLNQLVLKAIEGILSQSKHPPVIIVQGDHGSGVFFSQLRNPDMRTEQFIEKAMVERFSILNAIYIPNSKGVPFSPDMTPVNTFRVILNQFFHTQLDLLPNKSFTEALEDKLTEISPILDKASL